MSSSMVDMARKVDSFPPTPGRPKYPWDKWFDGSIWELKRGKDFDCKATSLRVMAVGMATDRNLTVKTRTTDENTVYIQAVKP